MPSGSPGLTCHQKAHETPRLKVARCDACDTYAAISRNSSRQMTCSSLGYRFSKPKTNCAAVDLAFYVVPSYGGRDRVTIRRFDGARKSSEANTVPKGTGPGIEQGAGSQGNQGRSGLPANM
jgi:hypothetical protein